MKTFLSLLAVALLSGCVTQSAKHAAVEIEQAAITANDAQLRISKKGLCASSLSAIKREFGDDPVMLVHLLGLCGWSDHNINVMTTGSWRPLQ